LHIGEACAKQEYLRRGSVCSRGALMLVMSLEMILAKRVVPAATVDDVDQALPLAGALLEADLDIVEITFRTEEAAGAIRRIVNEFPEMVVGAGTVLTPDMLDRAIESGVSFAVAPGLNETIVSRALNAGLAFVPGVMTPTEIDRGIELGCNLLKFFPAEALGGVKMLKALAGPYAHTGVKFLPTGGIDAGNAAEYLALDVVGAVGGSWMVRKDLIRARKWGEITRLARQALEICSPSRA